MEILTIDELRNLAALQPGWCVSIYFPTVEKGQQVRQNPIRLKNLLDQAQDELKSTGMEISQIKDFFAPAEDLLRDEPFWQHQQAGLAVFIARNFFRYYQIPVQADEIVVVNNHFYLKPLLPLLYGNDEFYILAISQNQVRLIKATEREAEQVDVPNLPKNFQEALGYDDLQRSLQWQTGTGQADQSGERRAMFHGHGEGKDNRKDFLLNYMHKIDRAVSGYLKDNKAPLILASVEYLQPIYKEANTYQNLSDELIPGSPDGVRDNALRDQAWKLIKPVFQTTKAERANQYKILAGRKDPLAVKDVAEIIRAAPFGRIDVLFVDRNARKWGVFDEKSLEVRFENGQRPGNQDLLDFAAVQTILNGGTVFPVDPQDLPEKGSPAAAILRF
jgi:Bacterial archaeo-eukaryotic release factor family 7